MNPIADSWVLAALIEDSLVRKYMAGLSRLPRKRNLNSARIDSLDSPESSSAAVIQHSTTRINHPGVQVLVDKSVNVIPNHRKRKLNSARIDSLDCPESISPLQVAEASPTYATRLNHPVVRASVALPCRLLIRNDYIRLRIMLLSVFLFHR